jgi:hypothetical protein
MSDKQIWTAIWKANPPQTEHLYGGVSITNQDIFDAINRVIMRGHVVAELAKLGVGELYNIGSICGVPIFIDYNGIFQVGDIDDIKQRIKPEPESPAGCAHREFVARDTFGEFKYICRSCDERFVRHPRLPQPDNSLDVFDIANRFRDGVITFSNACKEALLSAEQFKQAIKDMFPPEKIYEDVYRIGGKSQRVCVGEEPQRTSDPEDIESIFPTVGLSFASLQDIWMQSFPDVVGVTQSNDIMNDVIVTNFEFCDGTIQRVETDRNRNPVI